jgi:putative ABC transport system permease protein
MTWRDTIRSAFDAIRSHRLRSALTMLGILIGITAVVLTVGIGAGARAEVRSSIDALGTNLLVISPGSDSDSAGTRGGFGTASTLTTHDAEALDDHDVVPDVEAVAAVSETTAPLVAGEENWTTTLMGTTDSWQDIRSRTVVSGRFFDDERDGSAAVVVIGTDIATELFGTTDVIGETVSYDGTALEIIGVLETIDSSSDASANDVAIVPLSTYAQRLVGGSDRDAVDSIYVKATSADTLSAATQEADALLTNLHGISSADDVDFSIASESSVLEAATSVDDTLTIMLGGIAAISLLVGGVGVMNIMLVSVTERIREIGLRKAIGARPRFIRRQFLVEASILGMLGGILGVGLGVGLGVALPRWIDSPVEISAPAALAAVVMAIVIGVVFGVYPASRAARLTPIDALRSE